MAVNIRVNADTSRARSDLSKLENSVKSIDKTTKNVTRSLTRLAQGIATAFGTTVAVKAVNRATNSLIELENRTALVTGRTKQLGTSLDNLYKIARQSRQSVGLAAETFNRFGLALANTGASVADIEKATLSVQRALSISGGSAESASAAIFQLGQGLASGTLRGQELNSVLEQAPRIALAIADNLGVAQSELRALAADGKITTDVVFEALLNQSSKLEKEFSVLEQTSSQAFTVMSDSLNRVIGEISRGIGFTSLFTNTFNKITDALVSGGQGFEIGIYAQLAELQTLVFELTPLFEATGRVVSAFGGRVRNAIRQAIVPLRTVTDSLYVSFLKPILAVERRFRIFGLTISSILDKATLSGSQGGITALFRADSIDDAVEALATIEEAIDKAGRRFINFGGLAQNAINPILISAENLGVRLGIIDQRLLRFRSTSMEDFNFLLGLTIDLLDEVYRNILALSAIRPVIVAFVTLRQQVKRALEGLNNDLVKVFTSITKSSTGIFGSVFDKAASSMSKTADLVYRVLAQIERAFFWAYDQIIGNSWWTDLMEETYALATNWLGKTTGVVGGFSNTIISSFQTIYDKALPKVKEVFDTLSKPFKSRTVEIDVKTTLTDFIKDPVGAITGKLREIFVAVGKPLGAAIAEAYKELREISPFLTGIVTAIFGAKFISLVSTSFADGITSVIRGGVFAAIGLAIIDAFGDALLDSGAIADFASGIGAAAGKFIELFITNIPQIVRALGQVAIGFGQGLADSISGIPGLLLKGLMSIPLANVLPGVIATGLAAYFTGLGPKKTVDNFIKSRQSAFDADAKKLEKIARKTGANLNNAVPKINFLESALIGRGGARRTLAKFSVGILAADTLLRGVFGDSAFTDILIGGGFVLSLLFGERGYASVIKTVTDSMKAIGSAIKVSFAARNATPLFNLLSTFGPTLASIYQRNMGIAGQAVGSVLQRFTLLNRTVRTTSGATVPAFASSFQQAMFRAGRSIGRVVARMSRLKKSILGLGIIAAAVSWGSDANAAAADTEAQVQSLFQRITAAAEAAITHPLGVIGLMLFGGVAGAALLKAAGSIASKLSATLGASALRGLAKVAPLKEGILSLAILGEGSIKAGIGVALRSAAVAVAGFVGTVGAIIAGVVALGGLAAIAIFGEGDSIGERFGNAYDGFRKLIGLSSRAAARIKSDLRTSLGELKDIGDIKVNFAPLIDTLSFEDLNAKETKELQKIAKRTNRILSAAQRNLEENGALTASETRRVERAVAFQTAKIIEFNAPDAEERAAGAETIGDQVFNTLINPLQTVFDDALNGRGASREIANQLALPTKASDELTKEFQNISKVLSEGTAEEAAFAVQGFLTQEKLLEELQASNRGAAFVEALDNLFGLTQPGRPEQLTSEALDSLFVEFSKITAGTGSGFSRADDISSDAFKDISEALKTELEIVTAANQAQIRSVREQEFEDAATLLEQALGDRVNNLELFKDTDLAKVGSETLRELTRQFREILTNYNSQLERLQGPNQNVISDVARESIVNRTVNTAQSGVDQALATLKISIEEAAAEINSSIVEINAQSDRFGLERLTRLPSDSLSSGSKLFEDSFGTQAKTQNQLLRSQLITIENIQNKLDESKDISFEASNALLAQLEKEKQLYNLRVERINEAARAESDRLGLIQEAVSEVANSISINEAFALDNDTLNKVTTLTTRINLLGLALKRLQLEGAEGVDPTFARAIQAQITASEEALKNILSRGEPSDTTSDDTSTPTTRENPFETFVSNLSLAGFSFELKEAASLGVSLFEKLKAPAAAVGRLTKQIAESSLDDAKGRQAAVQALKEQRDIIFDTLSGGTVGQRNQAIEGLGLDSSQVGVNEQTLAIGLNIKQLREELLNTSGKDYETQANINRELEYQQSLLDNLTTNARQSSDAIRSAFSEGFKSLLKGEGTIKDFFTSLLDTLSNQIIDTVVDSFTQAFFRASKLDTFFDNLFAGLSGAGSSVGEKVGEDVVGSIKKKTEESSGNEKGGLFSGLFSGEGGFLSGLKDTFSDLFSGEGGLFSGLGESLSGLFGGEGGLFAGLGDSLSGLFSGLSSSLSGLLSGLGGGGGGGLGGLLSIFGFNEGGIVPAINTTRTDIDSVPTMLTPGELVVPADKVDAVLNGNSNKSSQVFNINVSGDVSRQTRKEIVAMMPQIASGVNTQNKERNFRSR